MPTNIFDMSDLWNNVSTTFNAIKMNVNNAASAASSKLLDLQTNGTSKFSVEPSGIANGETPPALDNSKKLATTAWVNTNVGVGPFLPVNNPAATGKLTVREPSGNIALLQGSAAGQQGVVWGVDPASSDAQVNIHIVPKGNAGCNFYANGALQAAVSGPPATTDYLILTGSASMQDPIVAAALGGPIRLDEAILVGPAGGNFAGVYGSAGAGAAISFRADNVGGDPNVNIHMIPKGIGGTIFYSNGSPQAIVNGPPGTTHYVNISGSAGNPNIQAAFTTYIDIINPNLTGVPLAPTAAPGTNTTQIATTAFVGAAVSAGGGSFQPLDADLTSIAAASGVNVIYYRSAANTWSPVAIGANLTFTGGTLAATGGGGGVTDAEYITSAVHAGLSAERVLTNTASITWDFSTPGQAKANTAGGGGNVSNTGTPAATQYARWTNATTIEARTPAQVLSDIGAQAAGSFQTLDATLTSLAAYNTNGLITQTAADTFAGRSIAVPAAGISITNANGVSGNPTLALANDLAALEALTGTNTIYYRSGSDAWSAVTFSGLTFTGGVLTASGGGGNVSNSGTPTVGQYGKWVTATTIQGVAAATVLSDIGAVAKIGDTMSGALTVSAGGINVTGNSVFTGDLTATGNINGGANLAVALGGMTSGAGASFAFYTANFSVPCLRINHVASATRFAELSPSVAGNPRFFASAGRLELTDAELTGTPQAVTPTLGDNSTKVATTAFVQATAGGGASLPLVGTGATVTTSQPLLDLSQTWNDGAVTFTGVKLNVTSTASAAQSLIMDLQSGGVSSFSVNKLGSFSAGQGTLASDDGGQVALWNNCTFGWSTTGSVGTAPNGIDLALKRDAAGCLAQRNGPNAQAFRVYNTHTDASNYERGVLDWFTTANRLTIGTQVAGTGTPRAVEIKAADGAGPNGFSSTYGMVINSGNAGSDYLGINAGGGVDISATVGTPMAALHVRFVGGQIMVGANPIQFGSAVGLADVGIRRVSAGLLEVDTGTLGVLAGLRVATIESNARYTESEVNLTDGATVALDSALGNTFKLLAAGDRTISVPTNKPASGKVQKIVIMHEASAANRTLTLTTGSAGSFRFGTDITGLTATTNGLVDYIGCIYNDADDRWDVVSYSKGY